MSKASEYRRQATQCREMAERVTQAEHRAQLLEMAATWEQLALDAVSETAEPKPPQDAPADDLTQHEGET